MPFRGIITGDKMSYNFTINGVTTSDKMFGHNANTSTANAFRNISNYFQGVAVGSNSAYITTNAGPVKATGTIVIATGNMSDEDTITINSVVLSAETLAATNTEFTIGTNAFQTAVALAACINALPSLNTLVTAVVTNGPSTSTTVTVTALGAGTAGNYTWSQSGSNVTLTPASAMGGGANGPVSASDVFTITASNLSDEDTVTIGATTFAAETSAGAGLAEFTIGANALATAVNLAALINSWSTTATVFNAVATGTTTGIVTVTCLLPGQLGNNVSVTKSATNGSWSGTTFFTGGTDAVVTTLHKGI
jgi:hypothetical protein